MVMTIFGLKLMLLFIDYNILREREAVSPSLYVECPQLPSSEFERVAFHLSELGCVYLYVVFDIRRQRSHETHKSHQCDEAFHTFQVSQTVVCKQIHHCDSGGV